jgi:hypothetical protein
MRLGESGRRRQARKTGPHSAPLFAYLVEGDARHGVTDLLAFCAFVSLVELRPVLNVF